MQWSIAVEGDHIDRCVLTFLATHNIRNCFGYIVVVVVFLSTLPLLLLAKNFHIFLLTTLRLSSYHIFSHKLFSILN